MSLQVAVVTDPASRARVEEQPIVFFLTVAAALPGEHGAAVSRLPRRPARLRQAAPAIQQERAREPREAKVQERKNEEFVPEDVTAISLAGPATGWNASVQLDHVPRHGLQQVKDLQPDHAVGVVVCFAPHPHEAEITAPPELNPGERMASEQLREAAGA